MPREPIPVKTLDTKSREWASLPFRWPRQSPRRKNPLRWDLDMLVQRDIPVWMDCGDQLRPIHIGIRPCWKDVLWGMNLALIPEYSVRSWSSCHWGHLAVQLYVSYRGHGSELLQTFRWQSNLPPIFIQRLSDVILEDCAVGVRLLSTF